MKHLQIGTMNDNTEIYKAISKDFNLLSNYEDKLNFYLSYPDDVLDIRITSYSGTLNETEDIRFLEYHISIVPQTSEERRLYNTFCCCLNLAKNYKLEQFDKFDFEGVLAQCIETEKDEIDKTIKENSLPMEYVEAKIKDCKDKLEDSNCHKIKNCFDDRTIEMQVYNSLLKREAINYNSFLCKEIESSRFFNDIYHQVVRLGIAIVEVHILHYLEGELNKFRNTDYLKEILQNQKKSFFQSPTKSNNHKESQNTEDFGIEDYKEIFIKSFFGETVSTQEISDYFEYESVKFMSRFSNENLAQRIKEIIFKKFIRGIEDANTNLSKPFIEREFKRLLEISNLKVQGVDISEIEKPSRYNGKIPLPYLCKKFDFGIHIELEQIEFINEGFELFKNQHENLNKANATTNSTTKQPIETIEFDKKILDNFIPKAKIPDFIKFEQELIDNARFDYLGKWEGGKNELAAFILLLMESEIFNYKHSSTHKKLTRPKLRDFFMERYKMSFDNSLFGKSNTEILREELTADRYKYSPIKKKRPIKL
jgi:hypothetical protein